MKNRYKPRKKYNPSNGRKTTIIGLLVEKTYRKMNIYRGDDIRVLPEDKFVYLVVKPKGRPVLCRDDLYCGNYCNDDFVKKLRNDKIALYSSIETGCFVKIHGIKYPHQTQGVIIYIESIEVISNSNR